MRKNSSNKGLTCSWEESKCEKRAEKKGYCNPHYMKYYSQTPRQNDKGCSVDGCVGIHRARGFCVNHHKVAKIELALNESEDTFDYDRFWLWVKRELKIE